MAKRIRQLCSNNPFLMKGVFMTGGPEAPGGAETQEKTPQQKTDELLAKMEENGVNEDTRKLTTELLDGVFHELYELEEAFGRINEAALIMSDAEELKLDNPEQYKSILEAYKDMLSDKTLDIHEFDRFQTKYESTVKRIELRQITERADVKRNATQFLIDDSTSDRMAARIPSLSAGRTYTFDSAGNRAAVKHIDLNDFQHVIPAGVSHVIVIAPDGSEKVAELDEKTHMFNEGLRYGQAGYVALLEGYKISVPVDKGTMEAFGADEPEPAATETPEEPETDRNEVYADILREREQHFYEKGVESLERNQRVELPSEFSNWTIDEIKGKISNLDAGPQISDALSNLSAHWGEGGPYDLLDQLLKGEGNGNKESYITTRRLTRRVTGTSRANVIEASQAEGINGPNRTFIVNAQKLIEGLQEMSTNWESEEGGLFGSNNYEYADPAIEAEMRQTEAVLGSLFDLSAETPIVKPRLGDRLRGERNREFTMEESEERMLIEAQNKLAEHATEEGAYNYIMRMVMDVAPDQRYETMQKICKDMMEKGFATRLISPDTHISGLQAQPELTEFTPETLASNPDALELIRLGVAMSIKEQNEIQENTLDEENVMSNIPEAYRTGYPITDKLWLTIMEELHVSGEELTDEQKTALSDTLVREYAGHERLVGGVLLGLTRGSDGNWSAEAGFGVGKSFVLMSEPVEIALSVGAGWMSGSLSVGAGLHASKRIKRFTINGSVAAGYTPELGFSVGTEGGADYHLGKHERWYVGGGAGVGARDGGVGIYAYAQVGQSLEGSLSRNIDNNIQKETAIAAYRDTLMAQDPPVENIDERVAAFRNNMDATFFSRVRSVNEASRAFRSHLESQDPQPDDIDAQVDAYKIALREQNDSIEEELPEKNVDAAVARYKTHLESIEPPVENIDAKAAAFREAINDQMRSLGIDDLGKVRFVKFRVNKVLGVTIPIPYIEIGFKGKKHWIVSPSLSTDATEQAAGILLMRQQAEQEGSELSEVTIYAGGEMLLTGAGYKNAEAGINFNAEDALGAIYDYPNADARFTLMEEGNNPSGVMERGLRLDVDGWAGGLDVYADPASPFKVRQGEDGGIYLVTESNKVPYIFRPNYASGDKSNGTYQSTEIFITDDPDADPNIIRAVSGEHIRREFDPVNRQIKDAYVVTDTTAEFEHRTAYETGLERIENEDGEVIDTFDAREVTPDNIDDIETRNTVQEQMGSLLHHAEANELTLTEMGDIDLVATHMMDKYPSRLSYKKLSVMSKEEFGEVTALILREHAAMPNAPEINWDGRTLAYMAQSLMEAAVIKNPPTLEQILPWNEKALVELLTNNGMQGLDAVQTARKAMLYFHEQLEKYEENPELAASLLIPTGWSVGIESGTEGVRGLRQSVWQDPAKRLLFPVDLNKEDLMAKMLLDEDQAEAMLLACRDHLAPLDVESPRSMFESQIGQQVLEAAHLIFPVETAQRLVGAYAIYTANPNIKLSEYNQNFQEAFNEFTQVISTIRETGRYETDQFIIDFNVDTENAKIGFYENCRNLTLIMNEQIIIRVKPGMAAQVDMFRSRDASASVDYLNLGNLINVKVEPLEPPEDEDRGEPGDDPNPPNGEDDDHEGSGEGQGDEDGPRNEGGTQDEDTGSSGGDGTGGGNDNENDPSGGRPTDDGGENTEGNGNGGNRPWWKKGGRGTGPFGRNGGGRNNNGGNNGGGDGGQAGGTPGDGVE